MANDGALEYYDGTLRVMDGDGNIIADKIDPANFHDYFGEATEEWSYLKFPYYKPLGYAKGMYRVGPLARVNICDYIDTPLAEAERRQFKALAGDAGAVNNSFYYHYARLIEILFCVEKIEMLLNDPVILGQNIRAKAMINQEHGIGASEAPRGTLFHDYWVTEDALLKKVDLVIATAQNNLAMNRTVRQLAHAVPGRREGHRRTAEQDRGRHPLLRPVSVVLDACHRQMPLHVQVVGPDNTLLCDVRR